MFYFFFFTLIVWSLSLPLRFSPVGVFLPLQQKRLVELITSQKKMKCSDFLLHPTINVCIHQACKDLISQCPQGKLRQIHWLSIFWYHEVNQLTCVQVWITHVGCLLPLWMLWRANWGMDGTWTWGRGVSMDTRRVWDGNIMGIWSRRTGVVMAGSFLYGTLVGIHHWFLQSSVLCRTEMCVFITAKPCVDQKKSRRDVFFFKMFWKLDV